MGRKGVGKRSGHAQAIDQNPISVLRSRDRGPKLKEPMKMWLPSTASVLVRRLVLDDPAMPRVS